MHTSNVIYLIIIFLKKWSRLNELVSRLNELVSRLDDFFLNKVGGKTKTLKKKMFCKNIFFFPDFIYKK